jgi:hypothetical protein
MVEPNGLGGDMFGDFAGTIIIRLRRLTEEERSSARPMAKSTSFVESLRKAARLASA